MLILFPLVWLTIPLGIGALLYVPYAAYRGRAAHPLLFASLGAGAAWIVSGSWLVPLIVASVLYQYALSGDSIGSLFRGRRREPENPSAS
jgi:hypothetical protein